MPQIRLFIWLDWWFVWIFNRFICLCIIIWWKLRLKRKLWKLLWF
jgi:hypothetical protein